MGTLFTVLIVEDDDDIREEMGGILGRYGFEVLCAPNGQAALDLLARIDQLPSVIVLDLMMPVMSGEEFLDALDQRG